MRRLSLFLDRVKIALPLAMTIVTIVTVRPAAGSTVTPLTPETRLTTTATDSETGLNHTPICVDGAGHIHVVWAEQDGPSGNYQVCERVCVNDTWQPSTHVVPWRAEFQGTLLGAKFPTITVDSADTLHLAWHDYRVGGINNAEIFYKKSWAFSPWDTSLASEIRVTTSLHPETNGDNSYVPTLVVDRTGKVHLCWYDFRFDANAGEVLYKARSGGAWDVTPGDAADENVSRTPGDSQFPAMVVDGWGRAHVAWQDDTSGNNRIFYAIREAGVDSFATPVELTTHAFAATAPALAVDGTGLVTVVWVDARDGARRIYGRRRTACGAWSPERPATPAYNADEPALAIDRFGQVHLAWHDTRISALNREVFLQTRAAGADWDSTGAHDVRVSNGTGSSTRPSLVADEGGRLHVVWKDRRDGNNEIYYRAYAVSSPVAVGDEGLAAGLNLRLAAGPNPFRAATTIFLPRSSDSASTRTIRVVSASGRLVRTLATSGDRVDWDGTDDGGRPVPPGVYFAGIPNRRGIDAVRLVRIP